MLKKCFKSVILLRKIRYYRQRSCSTCFFSWRNCFPTSSEVRCYVLFPFIAEKKSTLYLLLESHCFWLCSLLPSECCYFGPPTSSVFSCVCPVFPVALMLASKFSFWILPTHGFHSLTLVLNFGTTWLTESLLHLLQRFPKTHVSKVLPWLSSLGSLFLSPARGAALCHLLLFLDVLDI